jgi:hypothetical protein
LFEDSIYKKNPLSGNTKQMQLFYSTIDDPGVLYAKETNTSQTVLKMDLRKGTDNKRKAVLEGYDLEELEQLTECNGIKYIKQVELVLKWRKHVPDKYKSPLYNSPGEEVLQAVKDDRKAKKDLIEAKQKKKEAVNATGVMAAIKSPTWKSKNKHDNLKSNKESSTTAPVKKKRAQSKAKAKPMVAKTSRALTKVTSKKKNTGPAKKETKTKKTAAQG